MAAVEPLPQPSLTERVDALIAELRQARGQIVTPTVRLALSHAVEELSFIRADLTREVKRQAREEATAARRAAREAALGQPRRTTKGLNGGNRGRWAAKNNEADGTRLCAGCEKWKPFSEYDRKSPNTNAYRSHCRDCWRQYQRQRYVAANKKAIILEVAEGDEIVGATCNCCGRPFAVGDLLACDQWKHADCEPPTPAVADLRERAERITPSDSHPLNVDSPSSDEETKPVAAVDLWCRRCSPPQHLPSEAALEGHNERCHPPKKPVAQLVPTGLPSPRAGEYEQRRAAAEAMREEEE